MKKLFILLALTPCLGVASGNALLTSSQLDAINADNISKGLILPDSGLQSISASEITLPGQKEIRQQYLKDLQEMHKNGFVKQNSPEAQSLLSMKYNQNHTNKELKKNLADIKLAFSYVAPPFIRQEDIIGYTGFIAWDNGWLGISEFFKDHRLGVCNYSRHNLKLSHGAVQFIAEDIVYLINNKPTDHIMRGNDTTGYLSDVTWYDQTYIHNLQCAIEKFDPSHMDNALNLATRFDNVR